MSCSREITCLSFLGDSLVGFPDGHKTWISMARSMIAAEHELAPVLDVLESEFDAFLPQTREDVKRIRERLQSSRSSARKIAARVLSWGDVVLR